MFLLLLSLKKAGKQHVQRAEGVDDCNSVEGRWIHLTVINTRPQSRSPTHIYFAEDKITMKLKACFVYGPCEKGKRLILKDGL